MQEDVGLNQGLEIMENHMEQDTENDMETGIA